MSQLFNPDTLAGQTAMVTGASSGLGRHFAQVLAAHGAVVVCCARRADKLAETVGTITDAGGRALAIEMDVTAAASVETAFDTAEQNLGAITILVNNAGIAAGGRSLDLAESDWDRIIDTNLKGVWNVAQIFAARLAAAKTPGAIVNIASILGLRQSVGVLPYAVSKAGVVQMTKALALEWARLGIRVNAIAPGYIETDLNRDYLKSDGGEALMKRVPQRRFGQMEDLSGALLLLVSEASAYMTGEVIAVDGGHLVNTL